MVGNFRAVNINVIERQSATRANNPQPAAKLKIDHLPDVCHIVDDFDIAPETSLIHKVISGRDESKDLGKTRVGNVYERRSIVHTNERILFVVLGIRPPPNLLGSQEGN